MPLIEPTKADGSPSGRREKMVICGPAGAGKTSAPLSVAWWAHQAGDKRKFWFMDFDDSAGDLLLDKKYDGMTNIEVLPVEMDWEAWVKTSEKIVANAQPGDFIIGDMIDRGWKLVQEWEATITRKASRAEEMLAAAKEGKSGWSLFESVNWTIVNSQWDQFIKPILLRSPAHVIFTTEEVDLGAEAKRNEPADITTARREFGRYKPAGQKSLPYQARTVLRVARLNRGRTITTIKDRARPELNNEDLKPDFWTAYCVNVAGWKAE